MSDKSLVGKTIKKIELFNDQRGVEFVTDTGTVTAFCVGECCSQTWVENINMAARGLPAKVIDVENIPMPNLGAIPNRDVVIYYGLQITTDRGHIVIDYRNDSNGYYGGYLTWRTESSHEK